MGMNKSLSAVGEYDFYTADYQVFARTIANIFQVNIEAIFHDHTDNNDFADKADEVFDFQYDKQASLNVYRTLYDYKDKTGLKYISYQFYLHCDYYGEELLLFFDFQPNGIFEVDITPLFFGVWQFFIEDILGWNDKYYHNLQESIETATQLRNFYIPIFQKMNCNEIILWTDANYTCQDELLTFQIPDRKNTFADIVAKLTELDEVSLYNYVEILAQLHPNIFPKRDNCTDIAFIDRF